VLATRIKPGSSISIKDLATRAKTDLTKVEGLALLAAKSVELGALQELLFAAGTHSLLVVLQGMDTSGKDGTIREVFRDVNPAGVSVVPFKVPTAEELGHDFLWRIHQHTPNRGQIVIFNRSHYEDVLVVRVHDLVDKAIWSDRYEQINRFEELLADNNTIICKLFLHVSKDEQEQRLLAREQDITDAWKLSVGDWTERGFWNDYQKAYQDVLSKCSTEHAPWHVIPADQKWLRNLAVVEVLLETLAPFADGWQDKLESEAKVQLAALEEAREAGTIPRPSKKATEEATS
jgi:PPK2 family polyphosphate:nucleotide phosphotransferase